MKRASDVQLEVYRGENKVRKSEPVQRILMQQSLGTIPVYERADLLPSTASALNKAMDSTPSYTFLKEEEVYKVDEATLRYNIAASNYNGGRNIVQNDLPFRTAMAKQKSHHRIVEDQYLDVIAEPTRGLYTVNPVTRSAFNNQKTRTTGASNTMRAFGVERYVNPKIFPRLPTGIPFSVDPQRPVDDAVRINNNMVQPISSFPIAGF